MKGLVSSVSAIRMVTSAVLMMLLAAFPALAQLAGPCTADFATYCGGIVPGAGRLGRCYEQQKSHFSPSCIAWAEAVKVNAESLSTACRDEIDENCDSVSGDPMALLDCLQNNYIDLSPDCRTSVNQLKYYNLLPAP